jgi:hypothetical protein
MRHRSRESKRRKLLTAQDNSRTDNGDENLNQRGAI